MTINDVKIIELPKFLDARGNLSFAENYSQIPFEIKRTYWLYDVPGGISRGGHAEINNEELIIAISGSFDIYISDGVNSRTFTLNRSYYGLYIPCGLWREIRDFSTNALALEFGSILYDEADYIRDFNQYQLLVKSGQFPYAKSVHQICIPERILEDDLHKMYNVFDCNIIELSTHHSDRKGNLSVIENGRTLPFDVKRAYYLYDVPGGESRGAHAHKDLSQLIIAASGSFNVTLDDGCCKRTFFMNRPYQGLYVKPGMWRTLDDFSSGAVCVVFASDVYNEDDYIRTYEDFIDYRKTIK